MINPGEMQTVAGGRAKTYAVLAALYSAPPTEELAALIRAGGLAPEGGSLLSAAAEALTQSFRRAASDGLPDAELVAEHTRLFTLPSGVVPHESYYADENQRVGGHVTAGVMRYYDTAAAKLTGACLELPDHIGVELEFMHLLAYKEAYALVHHGRGKVRLCRRAQRPGYRINASPEDTFNPACFSHNNVFNILFCFNKP